MKKIPITTKPLDYFQHQERKHNPRVVALDIVEWESTPVASNIQVKESRDKRLIARAKRKWEKHIKESQK